jgi:hypothetical protein
MGGIPLITFGGVASGAGTGDGAGGTGPTGAHETSQPSAAASVAGRSYALHHAFLADRSTLNFVAPFEGPRAAVQMVYRSCNPGAVQGPIQYLRWHASEADSPVEHPCSYLSRDGEVHPVPEGVEYRSIVAAKRGTCTAHRGLI